jgi:hypothetical protein
MSTPAESGVAIGFAVRAQRVRKDTVAGPGNRLGS